MGRKSYKKKPHRKKSHRKKKRRHGNNQRTNKHVKVGESVGPNSLDNSQTNNQKPPIQKKVISDGNTVEDDRNRMYYEDRMGYSQATVNQKAAKALKIKKEIKEKYDTRLKKEKEAAEEKLKKVNKTGVIEHIPNETTKNKVGELGSTKFESEEDINEEIKRFNREISLFNFAQFIIKSIFFGVKEEDVESQIEDKLFKILQRLRLKVKKAIDKLNDQESKVIKTDAYLTKEALDDHFKLFHESLLNDKIERGEMDKLETKILDFFKRHRNNLDSIKGKELKLEKTPNEFDKVTRFLKAYQINQTKIVEALTNMLKKAPKIGEKLFIFIPVAGDVLNALNVIDDAKDIAEDLATINAVSETLGGERFSSDQGRSSSDQGRTRSNTVGGKKTKKRITKKRRTTTKKRRTKRRKRK